VGACGDSVATSTGIADPSKNSMYRGRLYFTS
jgi:hypothetical protein